MDHNKNNQPVASNKYSAKEWAMFGLFPILKTLAVPPTQPLAKIANEQQKSVTKLNGPYNFIRAAKQIYSVRGLVGFFDGTVASMNRELLKSSYKGLLQVGAKDFSKKLIPDNLYGANFIKGAMSGTIVGVLDPIIIAPVERYKTFKLSQDKSGNFSTYIKGIVNQQPKNITLNAKILGIGQELYRGTGVTIAKQTLMNVAFFTTKGWADTFVKPYENDCPKMSMAFASIAAGTGAAVVGAPLDVAKTLKQQQTGGENISTKKLLKRVLKQSGWKGLFAGVPARFLLINIGYGLNGLFLNLFDKYRTQKPDDQPPSTQSHHSKEMDNLTKQFSEKLTLTPAPDFGEDDMLKQFEQLSITQPVIFSPKPEQGSVDNKKEREKEAFIRRCIGPSFEKNCR